MVFAYYRRLNRQQKTIYRQSDAVHVVHLPNWLALQPLVSELELALREEDQPRIETLCQRLLAGLTEGLNVEPLALAVLEVRPHSDWGELHGLYRRAHDGAPATIVVWMRTAQRAQVVAFRTFLRTLLHELCHHLDYQLLELADSFHTEGFYKRESSLFHQLVPDAVGRARGP
jgi:hypothetical protein